MSKSSKLYRINAEIFTGLSAKVAKLPKQQQIILNTMAAHCTDNGLKGSDIVDLAKREFGLETRQKSTVLYAWYARSNEQFGVFSGEPVVITEPVVETETKKSRKSA